MRGRPTIAETNGWITAQERLDLVQPASDLALGYQHYSLRLSNGTSDEASVGAFSLLSLFMAGGLVGVAAVVGIAVATGLS